MTKQFKVGGVNLNIPDYSSEVGRVLEILTNEHEAGQLKTVMVVWAGETGVTSAVAGNFMMVPACALVAEALCERVIDDFTGDIFATGEDDE